MLVSENKLDKKVKGMSISFGKWRKDIYNQTMVWTFEVVYRTIVTRENACAI